MNNQDWKGVENSGLYWDHLDEIHEIIKKAESTWPLNGTNITANKANRTLSIAVNCLDFGIIIGKRMERARRKEYILKLK